MEIYNFKTNRHFYTRKKQVKGRRLQFERTYLVETCGMDLFRESVWKGITSQTRSEGTRPINRDFFVTQIVSANGKRYPTQNNPQYNWDINSTTTAVPPICY